MSDYIAFIVARDNRFRVAILKVASPIASPQWAEQDGRPFESETYQAAVDYLGQLPPRFWMRSSLEPTEPSPARVTSKRTRKGNARAK